jgi:glycerol uptake facilitator-like aquaporin
VNARLIPVFWRSAGITFRALWRATRQLFHEAAGTLFGVFAAYGALAAWRQWKQRPILWLTGFAVAYAVMMAAFAFAAFRRARRVR